MPWRSQGGVGQASPPDPEPDPGLAEAWVLGGGILVEQTDDRQGGVSAGGGGAMKETSESM